MEQISQNIVDISYLQTGASSATNELGMREMQAKAYEARQKRFLLIKAPPASGKSRVLMFIALDKLMHQGMKWVVVAVPEKSIGRSFQNTRLMPQGFFADWEVTPYFNLTDVKNERDKKGRFIEFFHQTSAKILVCAHATLRNGMVKIGRCPHAEDYSGHDCRTEVRPHAGAGHQHFQGATEEMGERTRRTNTRQQPS